MRILAVLAALIVSSGVLCAGTALAQQGQGRRHDQNPQRQMRGDERQRMRDDIRDAYRERPGREERPERPRQLSPEERDKLRRDIDDANRQMKRKK